MLLDKLIAKQEELGISDIKFAAMLDIPRSTWQLTRTGKISMGATLARAAIKTFPDLAPDVVSFLLSDATPVTRGANKLSEIPT